MRNKIFLAEFIGCAFLVMIIVGSGIMAENLTNDTALMLIANTLATGAGLFVLIASLADVSGAHFNPVVTTCMFFAGKTKRKDLINYYTAQILGCMLGVMLANFMFDQSIIELSRKMRPGINIFTAEIIATFGLIFIIFGTIKSGKIVVASSVGAFISAGYWFTSSTSFANPAVAIARTFTDTFTGINIINTPSYILAEVLGGYIAYKIVRILFLNKR